jgi:hypothetical protein
MTIKAICRDLRVSRKVVRKVIRSQATEFHYQRYVQPQPKIGPWRDRLDSLLLENDGKPARERLTLIRVFEELRALGFEGGYDAVRRYARAWSKERASETVSAYVPLSFAPGEAYQFDWSHDIVVMDGGDDDREGRARSPLPQPHHAGARLSARNAGDGFRRARTRLRILQGRLLARHLRQSMDVSRARRSVGVGGWNARIYPACCGTIVRPWPWWESAASGLIT